MGAFLSMQARPVPSGIINDLRDLRAARNALIKDQVAALTRAKTITLPLIKRHNAARLKQIEAQKGAIDTEINTLIHGDPDLAQRFAILCSIPGIAGISAAMLLIEMPELGNLDEKQVAALAGLAPIARQSGNWKGKAFIRGGRRQVRQALNMPDLVAICFNADFKAKYEQLIKAGKAPKQAITAVMRKFIILANAPLKKDKKWQPRVA